MHGPDNYRFITDLKPTETGRRYWVVSIIGTNVAQSLAGAPLAERLEARDKKPASKPGNIRKDDRDLYVTQAEAGDAVRGISSNEQEDANEDHRQGNPYTPGGNVDDGKRPPLDVEG